MKYKLEEFGNFLNSIDLQAYKDKYVKIKTVEMDLPKNVQALDCIYSLYWNKNKHCEYASPASFDDLYKTYFDTNKDNIYDFWNKTGFEKNCNCFLLGLEARIYRTWASLVTQIHAGYVAEAVFGLNSVEMSTALDHKGIDMQVTYNEKKINIQIKKVSKRPEILRMHSMDPKIGKLFNIWYVVPSPYDYENPNYVVASKKGKLRDSLKQFKKYNIDGTLDRLSNGFVIFTEKEFLNIKNEIDNC